MHGHEQSAWSGLEAVAHAGFGVEMIRVSWIFFELVA
jgi:hypothetical protein